MVSSRTCKSTSSEVVSSFDHSPPWHGRDGRFTSLGSLGAISALRIIPSFD